MAMLTIGRLAREAGVPAATICYYERRGLLPRTARARNGYRVLYGLEPRDPATVLFASASLGAIGARAGWVPASRASRINPAQILREG